MFAHVNDVIKNRHLKSKPELFKKRYPTDYQNILNSTPDDLQWIERLYRYAYDINTTPICETCGKLVGFISFTKGYARFCSPGCTSKNNGIKLKKQQTCIKNYGVDNPSKSKHIQNKKIETSRSRYGTNNPTQSKEIMDKIYKTKLEKYGDKTYNNTEQIKKTNLEKYGVQYFTQTPDFHDRSKHSKEQKYGDKYYNNPTKNKQTCLKKYGKEYAIASPKVREKIRETCMERYGVENPVCSVEFRKKIKKTNLEKYGNEYAIASPKVREKIRKTCMERYGVENPLESPEIKEKIKETNLGKYGCEKAISTPEVRKKLSESLKRSWSKKSDDDINRLRLKISKIQRPNDVIDSVIENGIINYICTCPHNDCSKCEEKTYQIPAKIHSNRVHQKIELCTKLFPIQYDRISSTSLEGFITKLLDEYGVEYKTNDRSILKGKELDIYIPNHNLAIECNGIYWHSLKDPMYHHMKWMKCMDKGIQLLTIWEDQIKVKPNIIKNIILSKLHIYEHVVGARQCKVKQVSSKDSSKFLLENHLQGNINGSERLGLYYMDKLVALMVFGRKRTALGNKRHDSWELYRYCCKNGWNISHGAERLFKHFLKDHPDVEVESFSSNDISTGELYKHLGFQKTGEQNYSYWYIDKNFQRYHRYTFRKDVLVRNGADPNMTEFEITDNMGLYRIYDSGQQKWILKSNQ